MSDKPSLSDRLAEEFASGQADLERDASLAAIPTPGSDLESVARSVRALKNVVDTLTGAGGSVLDKALTTRDMLGEGTMLYTPSAGLVTAAPTFTTVVGGGGGGGGGGGYADPRPVLTTPPTPTNLVARAAFKNVVLTWDLTAYRNHAYTEIWRNTTNNLGTASLYDTTEATVYSDAGVVLGTTYFYWVRAVNLENTAGTYNSATGTSAAPGTLGTADLSDLIITADKIASGQVTAGKIADGAVVANKIAAGAIAVGSAAIANGAIRRALIEDLAVDDAKIANLNATKITAGFIDAARINVGSLNADRLTAGTFTAGLFQANLFQTDNVATRGLTVRDTSGNVILSAGVPLQPANAAGTLHNDNVRAGGVNLLGNSGFLRHNGSLPTGWNIYNNGGISATTSVQAGGLFGQNYYRVVSGAATTQQLGLSVVVGPESVKAWEPGQTYCMSFWARGSGGAVGRAMVSYYSNMGFSSITVLEEPALTANWQRYVTRAVPANNVFTPNGEFLVSWFIDGSSLPSGATIDICCPKVELGNQPSAWTPAPLDTLNQNIVIDNATGALNGIGQGAGTPVANSLLQPLIDAKLNKSAADILSAPITLQSSGAIQTINGSNSVTLSPNGLVGTIGGVPRFTLNVNTGSLAVAGDITGSTGTFAGTVQVGSNPAVSGTTMTGTGVVLNPSGTAAFGSASANISFDGTVLTLNNVILNQPQLNQPVINTLPNGPIANPGNFFASDQLVAPGGGVVVNAGIQVEVRRDGTVFSKTIAGSPVQIGTWFTGATATTGDAYSIRFTLISQSGLTGGDFNGAPDWTALSATRLVSLATSSSAYALRDRAYDYTIRRNSDNVQVANGAIFLTALVEV